MNEKELVQDSEISLLGLLGALKEGWRWLVGSVVLGGIGAGAFLVLATPQYEAVALVQVGQISGEPVEPEVQAAERIKSSSFQLKVAEALGDAAWQDRLLRGAGKVTLSVQVSKKTPTLIELKVLGDSAPSALKIAEATLLELTRRHAELAAPTLVRIKGDLAIVQEKLVKAEAEQEMLLKSMSSASVRDDRSVLFSLMASLHEQKNWEIFSLRQQILQLNASLSEPSTQPVRAIEPVFVPERPVSPKQGLVLALGLVGGLLLGGISLLLRNALKKR